MALQLILALAVGLLLLPILLKMLDAALLAIRQRCKATLPQLAGFARGAFHWAGDLVCEHGDLSPAQAVSQVAGAILMIGATVVLFLCDLLFTLATLGPLLGLEVNLYEGLFTGLDQFAGFSVVLLAVVYGLIVADLLGWTCLTRFSRTERARVAAFFFALLGFLGSLVVAVALAMLRLNALTDDVTAGYGIEWLLDLPATILLLLAVLLLCGIALALTSLETFCGALFALLIAVGGVAVGVIKVLLVLVDVVAELILASVAAVRDGTQPFSGSVQSGLAKVRRAFANLGSAIHRGLRSLVGRTSSDTQASSKAETRSATSARQTPNTSEPDRVPTEQPVDNQKSRPSLDKG